MSAKYIHLWVQLSTPSCQGSHSWLLWLCIFCHLCILSNCLFLLGLSWKSNTCASGSCSPSVSRAQACVHEPEAACVRGVPSPPSASPVLACRKAIRSVPVESQLLDRPPASNTGHPASFLNSFIQQHPCPASGGWLVRPQHPPLAYFPRLLQPRFILVCFGSGFLCSICVCFHTQGSHRKSHSRAAFWRTMDARVSGSWSGWMRMKSCSRKCLMPSRWQLKAKHGYPWHGRRKKPALQLCVSSEVVKLTIVAMWMMWIWQWCYCKTKEMIWQMGNDGLDPHVFTARKDASMTNHTDATWRNRRWKAHFLCGLIRFLPATSAIDTTPFILIIFHTH